MKQFSAALLFAILPMSGTQADGLGRLFLTPGQRAQLEREHALQASAEDNHTRVLMLNGIVQKSSGTRTIWINGVAQNADSNSRQAPDTHAITAPGKLQSVEIKVGQRLLLEQATAK